MIRKEMVRGKKIWFALVRETIVFGASWVEPGATDNLYHSKII
jgi:hypothetical protein